MKLEIFERFGSLYGKSDGTQSSFHSPPLYILHFTTFIKIRLQI